MSFSNENSFHSPECSFSPTRSFLFLKNSEVNWKSKQSSLLSLFINQNKLLHLNRKGFHRNFRKWNNTADGGILPYNLLVCAYMHIATMVFPRNSENCPLYNLKKGTDFKSNWGNVNGLRQNWQNQDSKVVITLRWNLYVAMCLYAHCKENQNQNQKLSSPWGGPLLYIRFHGCP